MSQFPAMKLQKSTLQYTSIKPERESDNKQTMKESHKPWLCHVSKMTKLKERKQGLWSYNKIMLYAFMWIWHIGIS